MGTIGRMGRHLRRKTGRLIAPLLVVATALAACAGSPPAPSPAQPSPTIPLVITRIVTPAPTPTPLPPPTPLYDLSDQEGRWVLRVDVTISGGSQISELRYAGSADFTVTDAGLISGTGAFTPAISHPPCDAQVITPRPLAFALQGTTFAEGDRIGADLVLSPSVPDESEHYRLICPDYDDVRDVQQPILWAVLAALNHGDGHFTLEGLRWRAPLAAGQSSAFSEGLAAVFDGTLTIELRIGRG
jgi:hypothetical protein